MAQRFAFKKLFMILLSAGMLGLSQQASAAAFQLWELDGASIGNYHAGAAAVAEDASTAFYNPAGLIRIKNQELVLGGDSVVTDIRFKGTVAVNTLFPPTPNPVAARVRCRAPVRWQGDEHPCIPR